MMATTSGKPANARPVGLRWESSDRYPWAAPLAASGAFTTLAMAAFGVPPVDLHGPLHYLGIMDPLCGMTRAARHLARLDLQTALRYNPAIPAVAVTGLAAAGRWIHGQRTGRWLEVRFERRWYVLLLAGALLAVLAVRQQASVDLLR
ncbi:MAG: DUF2752 domain-containing protein [Acidimicrobiia bacterium]